MFFIANCSDSHQGTKRQRIDLPAIALAQARRAGMSFTPLSEKESSGRDVPLIKKGIKRIIL